MKNKTKSQDVEGREAIELELSNFIMAGSEIPVPLMASALKYFSYKKIVSLIFSASLTRHAGNDYYFLVELDEVFRNSERAALDFLHQSIQELFCVSTSGLSPEALKQTELRRDRYKEQFCIRFWENRARRRKKNRNQAVRSQFLFLFHLQFLCPPCHKLKTKADGPLNRY